MAKGQVILIGVLLLILVLIIYFRPKLKVLAMSVSESKMEEQKKNEAEKFVKGLKDLGYFKYADKSDIEILEKDIAAYFDPDGGFSTTYWYDSYMSKDYRCYPCDGEDVYEHEGIRDLLNELKPTFEKINFKCDITAHTEEWDVENNWLNHRITINGTEYIIFRNFTGTGWGEAPKRIAEILNAEFGKQGIDEKIYLISGGNDGQLIFLTDELYKCIYSVFKNPVSKPLDPEEWAEVMNVKPMNLN